MSIFNLDTNLVLWNIKAAQKFEDPAKKTIQMGLQSSCTIYVSEESQWSGSGFHIGNGMIVTASHVVPPSLNANTTIDITFDQKEFYQAKVLVTQPKFDAAILSSPEIAKMIPALELADSDKVEVGDLIAVIGAPEGFHDTATVGRISNIHQSLGEQAPSPAWTDIIFIDADIAEGSSGGMVLDMNGRVVGIIMGVTGQHADVGIGENSVCPSNKIGKLLSDL